MSNPNLSLRRRTAINLGLLISYLFALPVYAIAKGPKCSQVAVDAALDASVPVSARFVQQLKRTHIHTIIRYYDWKDETIRGKTLRPAEIKAIADAHLSVAVVFQHHNDRTATFTDPDRGSVDAARAHELAVQFHQPTSSVIYFGVDGVDALFADQMPHEKSPERKYGLVFIRHYFEKVGATLSQYNSSYRIGAYGSGLVCSDLLSHNLISICWLANATSWPGYEEFDRSKEWALKQQLPTRAADCFGIEGDVDVIGRADFGQWFPLPMDGMSQ